MGPHYGWLALQCEENSRSTAMSFVLPLELLINPHFQLCVRGPKSRDAPVGPNVDGILVHDRKTTWRSVCERSVLVHVDISLKQSKLGIPPPASTTLALDDRGRIVTGLTGLNLHGGRCRLSLCHPFPRPFCLHGQLEFLICLLLHRHWRRPPRHCSQANEAIPRYVPRYVLARGAGTLSMGTRRAPGAGGGVCGSGVLGRAREWWCSKICIRRHCCFCNVRGGRRVVCGSTTSPRPSQPPGIGAESAPPGRGRVARTH